MDDHDTPPLIPEYPVRLREALLVWLSAIVLIGAGLAGLGMKALGNAFSPWRAQAVAKSLMSYEIPGGSTGIFAIKFGGARVAWVRSTTQPPDVILFIGKTPLTKEVEVAERTRFIDEFQPPPIDNAQVTFTPLTSRTETRTLCGEAVPVTIETGKQTFSNQPTPFPALRYVAKVTQNETEQLVILTVQGQNALQIGDAVFRSLECKER
jgi:hypothetical protein